MKIRQIRGMLEDSMATVEEIEPTRKALEEYLLKILAIAVNPKDVHMTYYGHDPRIDWEVYLVTIDGYGVVAMTDDGIPGLTTPTLIK